MSEYLCRVIVDLTTTLKNNRNDIILDMFNHFDNGIIVWEEKYARVKIFPRETKHFSSVLSKATTCNLSCNKIVLHPVQKKTLLVFTKGEVSVVEENIFTNFETSIEKEFKSCCELESNAKQGRLCVPLHQTLIKNERKKVNGVVQPRLLKTYPVTVPLKQYSEENYMTGDNEYTNGTYSLQYCVANVAQPDGLQDVVICFACDGGLKNWDPEDDPWIEHARWFPQCPFVIRVKGHEFIAPVRRMTEDSDEEEDAVVHSTFQPNNPRPLRPVCRTS